MKDINVMRKKEMFFGFLEFLLKTKNPNKSEVVAKKRFSTDNGWRWKDIALLRNVHG